MRLALFQPDIPQNLGAALRLSACFSTPLDVIEPCGFPLTSAAMKRASLDYGRLADWRRHQSFQAFLDSDTRKSGRLILFETDGEALLHDFRFHEDDILMFGRESAGSPQEAYLAAEARIRVPLAEGARSLNVAMCAGICLFEALRQTCRLPGPGQGRFGAG